MALILAFLDPPDVHSFLTTPFSRTWLVTYAMLQGLWKIMCMSSLFYDKLEYGACRGGSNSGSDGSSCTFPICSDLELRHMSGRYRLLYTSFVRCMKYLHRLQDNSLNGRTPPLYSN